VLEDKDEILRDSFGYSAPESGAFDFLKNISTIDN